MKKKYLELLIRISLTIFVFHPITQQPQLDTERSVQGKHTFKDKCPTCHDVNLLTRLVTCFSLISHVSRRLGLASVS